jgi:hypothetical protein
VHTDSARLACAQLVVFGKRCQVSEPLSFVLDTSPPQRRTIVTFVCCFARFGGVGRVDNGGAAGRKCRTTSSLCLLSRRCDVCFCHTHSFYFIVL